MMDSSQVHPDLLGEAFSHSSQRVTQLGSLLASWAMVEVRRKEQRDAAKAASSERALQALREQERAAHRLARAGWAPADDRQWLAQADLLQTARVWSAAAAYADADPQAASALRRCEERLRTLHPYAMAWYDRLRGEGAGLFDAMREALPLFGREPHVRPGGPAPERRSLTASASPLGEGDLGAEHDYQQPGLGQDLASAADYPVVAWAVQARVLEERESALSPDELATVPSATTSLSPDVIAPLTSGSRGTRSAANTVRVHVPGDKSAVQLAAESFPCSITDAVRVAGTADPQEGQASVLRLTTQDIRRPSRSL